MVINLLIRKIVNNDGFRKGNSVDTKKYCIVNEHVYKRSEVHDSKLSIKFSEDKKATIIFTLKGMINHDRFSISIR